MQTVNSLSVLKLKGGRSLIDAKREFYGLLITRYTVQKIFKYLCVSKIKE